MASEASGRPTMHHDWHSADYVADWIVHDTARDPERRPRLQKMLEMAPFPRDAALEVLDVGAGYGAVTEEVLKAFPRARVTLQDYSQPMLGAARRRLAGHAAQLRYVTADLTDPEWPRAVGGPFDLAVSAIALHNLRDPAAIFACYRAIHDLLQPEGWFLDYDLFFAGIEGHIAELREAGFASVECPWQEPPRAILAAVRFGG
jgi:ubiquinone/menaquinone biosynthesis C-methylase UbiE